MTSPNDAAMDAWYDQMDAHYRDRDPDCACWDCRLIQALDKNEEVKVFHRSVVQEMLAPRKTVVPTNRQFIK